MLPLRNLKFIIVKHVVITGAAGQLGRVVCREFINAGYFVHALVSKNYTSELDFKSEFISVHKLDLTDSLEVEEFINFLKQSNVPVYAALFLAGGYAEGTIENTTKEQITKMMQLNFDTAFYISKLLFIEMSTVNSNRYLFFIGARPAVEIEKGSHAIAYTLSKSALVNLAQLYNLTPGNKFVHSHVIVPSVIDTPLNRAQMPDADFKQWISPETISEQIIQILSGHQTPGLIVKMYPD